MIDHPWVSLSYYAFHAGHFSQQIIYCCCIENVNQSFYLDFCPNVIWTDLWFFFFYLFYLRGGLGVSAQTAIGSEIVRWLACNKISWQKIISKIFAGTLILLTNRHEKKPNSCTEKRHWSLVIMGFDQLVRSLISLRIVQLVRSPLPFVDSPDECSQLSNCVAPPGMSELHPIHPRPLGRRSPPWWERDKTAGRVCLAPGSTFPPLHHISRRVNFCCAPEQGSEDHLVQIHLAMSRCQSRRGGPSWSRTKTYGVKFFFGKSKLWTEHVVHSLNKIKFLTLLFISIHIWGSIVETGNNCNILSWRSSVDTAIIGNSVRAIGEGHTSLPYTRSVYSGAVWCLGSRSCSCGRCSCWGHNFAVKSSAHCCVRIASEKHLDLRVVWEARRGGVTVALPGVIKTVSHGQIIKSQEVTLEKDNWVRRYLLKPN